MHSVPNFSLYGTPAVLVSPEFCSYVRRQPTLTHWRLSACVDRSRVRSVNPKTDVLSNLSANASGGSLRFCSGSNRQGCRMQRIRTSPLVYSLQRAADVKKRFASHTHHGMPSCCFRSDMPVRASMELFANGARSRFNCSVTRGKDPNRRPAPAHLVHACTSLAQLATGRGSRDRTYLRSAGSASRRSVSGV